MRLGHVDAELVQNTASCLSFRVLGVGYFCLPEAPHSNLCRAFPHTYEIGLSPWFGKFYGTATGNDDGICIWTLVFVFELGWKSDVNKVWLRSMVVGHIR
jgi:hypothetical protein